MTSLVNKLMDDDDDVPGKQVHSNKTPDPYNFDGGANNEPENLKILRLLNTGSRWYTKYESMIRLNSLEANNVQYVGVSDTYEH